MSLGSFWEMKVTYSKMQSEKRPCFIQNTHLYIASSILCIYIVASTFCAFIRHIYMFNAVIRRIYRYMFVRHIYMFVRHIYMFNASIRHICIFTLHLFYPLQTGGVPRRRGGGESLRQQLGLHHELQSRGRLQVLQILAMLHTELPELPQVNV